MKINIDISVPVAVLISDNCKPGEVILPSSLTELYYDTVAKCPDTLISVYITRYGAGVNIFNPVLISSSEKKYCELNVADAMSLGIDFSGDTVSVIFNESPQSK